MFKINMRRRPRLNFGPQLSVTSVYSSAGTKSLLSLGARAVGLDTERELTRGVVSRRSVVRMPFHRELDERPCEPALAGRRLGVPCGCGVLGVWGVIAPVAADV